MRGFMIPFAPHCAKPGSERALQRPTRSVMDLLMRYIWRVVACSALVLLAARGSLNPFGTKGVDYKSTASVPTLEVPPDLTMPTFDDRYRDRPGSATASGLAARSQAARSGLLPAV